MSLYLAVLAMGPDATARDVERQYAICCGPGPHREGDLDLRIVEFYEELRADFPDFGPLSDESPWMSTPLWTGIDHVYMSLSFSARSDPAIERIEELAGKWQLAVFDPQSRTAYLPDELTAPD